MAETLDDGEGVGNGLAATCAITADEVLAAVDDLECGVLDWEEELDALLLEHLHHGGVLDEVTDVLVLLSLGL